MRRGVRRLADTRKRSVGSLIVPWPSREASDHHERVLAVRWQVFGLTGCSRT